MRQNMDLPAADDESPVQKIRDAIEGREPEQTEALSRSAPGHGRGGWPIPWYSMNGFVPFSVIVVVEALEDRAVDQRTFNVVASVIFALVALLHLLRIYMGWPIVIGSWTAPMWVSWTGFVVGGGLSYFGLILASRS
jgi:hypothetical protein